jgi:hypothetical protein
MKPLGIMNRDELRQYYEGRIRNIEEQIQELETGKLRISRMGPTGWIDQKDATIAIHRQSIEGYRAGIRVLDLKDAEG